MRGCPSAVNITVPWHLDAALGRICTAIQGVRISGHPLSCMRTPHLSANADTKKNLKCELKGESTYCTALRAAAVFPDLFSSHISRGRTAEFCARPSNPYGVPNDAT